MSSDKFWSTCLKWFSISPLWNPENGWIKSWSGTSKLAVSSSSGRARTGSRVGAIHCIGRRSNSKRRQKPKWFCILFLMSTWWSLLNSLTGKNTQGLVEWTTKERERNRSSDGKMQIGQENGGLLDEQKNENQSWARDDWRRPQQKKRPRNKQKDEQLEALCRKRDIVEKKKGRMKHRL